MSGDGNVSLDTLHVKNILRVLLCLRNFESIVFKINKYLSYREYNELG